MYVHTYTYFCLHLLLEEGIRTHMHTYMHTHTHTLSHTHVNTHTYDADALAPLQVLIQQRQPIAQWQLEAVSKGGDQGQLDAILCTSGCKHHLRSNKCGIVAVPHIFDKKQKVNSSKSPQICETICVPRIRKR